MTPEWEGPLMFGCMILMLLVGIAYGRGTK